LITGDEDLCSGRNGVSQDSLVIAISQRDGRHGIASRNDLAPLEDGRCRRKCNVAHLQFEGQDPAHLVRNDLGNKKIMFGQDKLQEVGTEASSDEGGNKNVGIQTDPGHETSLKTSSSV
jgi:hypothetical protein